MKKYLTFIPLVVASILVLIHFIQVQLLPDYINSNGELVSSSMIDSVIFGSVGLFIIFILILLKHKSWKYVFLGLIILSYTPLIGFNNNYINFGLGSLTIDLTALVLLIFHLQFNPEILSELHVFSIFQE